MTIDEIRQLIARDETRTLELKKTTGELKGAPEPEYRTDNGCVTVIFRRGDRQNDRQNLSVTDCESKLSERQRGILAIIANDRQISAEVIGKKLKVSTTTVYRDIKAINKVMIVYWDGPSKTGHWVMQTKCR